MRVFAVSKGCFVMMLSIENNSKFLESSSHQVESSSHLPESYSDGAVSSSHVTESTFICRNLAVM
jgi:hypothetical protein